MAASGGELGDFEATLSQGYMDLARDTTMLRKRRAERVRRMMQKSGG